MVILSGNRELRIRWRGNKRDGRKETRPAALAASRQDMKGTVTEMTMVEEVTSGLIQDGFQRQSSQDLPWVRGDA